MLACESCGAGLSVTPGLPVAQCSYCGGMSNNPLPSGGPAPIATADFSGKEATGWRAWAEEEGETLRTDAGPPPHMFVALPAKPAGVSLMWLPGTFDDVDMTLGAQFGPETSTEASFALRFRCGKDERGHHDGYAAKLYADGYTGLEWRDGRQHGGWLAKIRKANGAWDPERIHAFRILAVGKRMRLYLDGALVGSFADDRFSLGSTYLTLSASDKPITARIYHLEAREGVMP